MNGCRVILLLSVKQNPERRQGCRPMDVWDPSKRRYEGGKDYELVDGDEDQGDARCERNDGYGHFARCELQWPRSTEMVVSRHRVAW